MGRIIHSFLSNTDRGGTAMALSHPQPELFLLIRLSIQFKQLGTATQFRLDDVLLTYAVVPPTISASGPTSFYQGILWYSVATLAPASLWSNGATTASISVSLPGDYTVSIPGDNGCSQPAT
ncbi:MAG: hypothetical protein IPJ66_17120 [Bacteroidetes bacterium]|nr:hypothetical protein [Bacteroidota bacterium]